MPAYYDPIYFLSGFDAARLSALLKALDFARRNRESGGVYASIVPLLDELEEFGGNWTASVLGSAEVPQTPDLVEVHQQEMTTKEAARVSTSATEGFALHVRKAGSKVARSGASGE
jgi:hypothetical protein